MLLGLPNDESGYPKVPAALRFDGKDWGRLTIRYKGNSSYRGAPGVLKRSLKLDFDEPDKTTRLLRDAEAESQQQRVRPEPDARGAGLRRVSARRRSAPRTAFAKVYITVPGQYQRQYAGLFTAIEQIDQAFFSTRWGQRVGVLVKPEGLRGMPELGDDWKRYESAYASKVTATPADAARFIAFVQFVAHATDDEFAKQIGDYVDVEEFLRFLAAEVVIVNTDSPLGMNHNYWMTVEPKTHKVVWLPWDMNMAFGGFRSGDIDLSLRSPSAPGMIPLADRLLASSQWVRRYNEILREMMTSNVTPARMSAEITGMAEVIREAVAADETTTLATFERSVAEQPSTDSDPNWQPAGSSAQGEAARPYVNSSTSGSNRSSSNWPASASARPDAAAGSARPHRTVGSSSRRRRGLPALPQQILDVADLVGQQIEFVRQVLNLRLRAAVDVVVQFAAQPVLRVLPVLAHHDDRRLNRRQHREKQVQQDERIRIPGA